MELELKCFALSNFQLCNFTDSECVTELTAVHTNHLPVDFRLSLFGSYSKLCERYIFSIICITLDCL